MKVYRDGPGGTAILVGETSLGWTRGGKMPELLQSANPKRNWGSSGDPRSAVASPYLFWQTGIVSYPKEVDDYGNVLSRESEIVIRLRSDDDPSLLSDWRPTEKVERWCNTHQRDADRCSREGGILLPCRIIDRRAVGIEIEAEANPPERDEENDDDE